MKTRKKFKKIRIITKKNLENLTSIIKNKIKNKIKKTFKFNKNRKNITRKKIVKNNNNYDFYKRNYLEKKSFNFNNTYSCRWCGSNIHNTNTCSLNI